MLCVTDESRWGCEMCAQGCGVCLLWEACGARRGGLTHPIRLRPGNPAPMAIVPDMASPVLQEGRVVTTAQYVMCEVSQSHALTGPIRERQDGGFRCLETSEHQRISTHPATWFQYLRVAGEPETLVPAKRVCPATPLSCHCAPAAASQSA